MEVSLNKGLARVKLKPGNTVRPQDFWETARKNGFTPKETRVVVRGEMTSADRPQLRVTGTDLVLDLKADAKLLDEAKRHVGNTVTVEGTLMPGKDPKGPVPLEIRDDPRRYTKMNAAQQTDTGLVSYLSLFTSFGTLLCCALPSLLVLFGLGATVASFLSSLPWLVDPVAS